MFSFFFNPYSAQEPSYTTGFLPLTIELARPKMQAVIPEPQVNAISLSILILFFSKIDNILSLFLNV